MKHLNKLRILTDTEREFIKASAKERTKEKFKNPTVIRKRSREKANNLILAIPELINDVNLLYKFSIEDELETLKACLNCIHDTDESTTGCIKTLLKLMPVLGLYDGRIDFPKSLDAKKMLFLAVSNLYWKTPDEYEKLTQQTCRNIRFFHDLVMSKNPIFTEKIKESKKFIDTHPIVKLLNSLTPNKRAVALTVFKSEHRITRNEIAKKTGLDKRLVTRYARELIKKEIIKNIEKKITKKPSKKIIKVDYYFWAEPVDVKDRDTVGISEEEIPQKLLQKLKQQTPL